MAIFKIESAIDDTIQSPNDVGNDLKQIEKDIAGPDGIESHREEIEDAKLGMIDDAEIAESVNMAIYESEYNLNQIFECLDINMLEAAANGREENLGDSDKEGFIATAISHIRTAFANFTKIMKNILDKIVALVSNNKKFVAQHEDAIRAGYEKLSTSDKDFKGIKYNSNLIDSISKRLNRDYSAELEQIKEQIVSAEDVSSAETKYKQEVISSIINNSSITSIPQIREYIAKNAMSEDKEDIRTIYGSSGGLITALKLDSASTIRAEYKAVQANIDRCIRSIKLEAGVAKHDSKDGNSDNKVKALRATVRVITDYQTAIQTTASILASIRSKESSQARKFANRCIAAVGVKETFKEPEIPVSHESATANIKSNSTISSIEFI